MLLEDIKVGFAVTGSFCTFFSVIPEMEKLVNEGAEVFSIISDSVNKFDTRFGTAEYWKTQMKNITKKEIIASIVDAEPIGPKSFLDIMIIAPCTGNSLAKLANAITDTPVTMAAKAHMRNQKPLVIAVSTNDGLGANAKNIGLLLNMKNVYFVPFGQDNPAKKQNSLVAKMDMILPTIQEALKGKQLQPMIM